MYVCVILIVFQGHRDAFIQKKKKTTLVPPATLLTFTQQFVKTGNLV